MCWGFILLPFFLISCKYNCLIQDYGRALYTIGLLLQRVFWTWVVHPWDFMNIFFYITLEYIHFQLYVWNSFCLVLSIGVNFDYITKIYQVCLVYECFFFLTRCIYHPNLGTIILSSLIRPTISHSNNELLCWFSLSSSMIWTITAFILSRVEL